MGFRKFSGAITEFIRADKIHVSASEVTCKAFLKTFDSNDFNDSLMDPQKYFFTEDIAEHIFKIQC